jgi:hypothetical protein
MDSATSIHSNQGNQNVYLSFLRLLLFIVIIVGFL